MKEKRLCHFLFVQIATTHFEQRKAYALLFLYNCDCSFYEIDVNLTKIDNGFGNGVTVNFGNIDPCSVGNSTGKKPAGI